MRTTGIALPVVRDGNKEMVELVELTHQEIVDSLEAATDKDCRILLYLLCGYALGWAQKIEGLEAKVHSLTEENTRIRAALAVSKDPCIYCQLPAAEMGKCKHGFPGCSRMDDITGCPEFGASMQLHDANAEIERLKQLIPKP